MTSLPTILFPFGAPDVYERIQKSWWLRFKADDYPTPLLIRVGELNNELVCTGLMLGVGDAQVRQITTSDLRLPLAAIVTALREFAKVRRLPYLSMLGIAVDHSPSAVVAIPRARTGRKGHMDGHWQEVADRYRAALKTDPRRPTKLVADLYYKESSVEDATVRLWIRQARQKGFLGKALIGRAGELSPKPRVRAAPERAALRLSTHAPDVRVGPAVKKRAARQKKK